MTFLNIFFGRTLHSRTLCFLVILCCFLLIIWYKKDNIIKNEGFEQEGQFIIKRDDDVYDDFYADIYKKLHKPEDNATFITDIIIKMKPDKEDSVMLFIGGYEETNILQIKGYDTYCIDKSVQTVSYANQKLPTLKIKVGNLQLPMMYDSATFTHISCVGLYAYRIDNKMQLFRNIYNWLIPNGIFIIQMADRNSFNTIVPAGKSSIIDNPQKYSDGRITETEINFENFTYNSKYDFENAEKNNIVIFSEVFTNKNTQKVRKNEQTLYFENIEDILKIVVNCGFKMKKKIPLESDENQYIFIFERPK